MKRHLWLLVALLLVATLTAVWLVGKLERYTRHWDDGPTLEVLFNPWFAAQALLQRRQQESHRSFSLQPVLDRLAPYDALVLLTDGPIGDPTTRQQLLDWMHGGGHLIVAAQTEWDFDNEAADPLLDSFGVRLYSLQADEEEAVTGDESPQEDTGPTGQPEQEPAAADNPEATADPAAGDTAEAAAQTCFFSDYNNLFLLEWQGQRLQIQGLEDYTLDDEYGEAIASGGFWPNPLLQYRAGAGKLTVLMDPGIWRNQRIGEFDHAHLLWVLTREDAKVWFVSSHASENLLAKLWRTAPYLLVGLLTLLLAWGWRRGARFGPLQPDPDTEHRQLLEHIEAATRFDWNHQQAEAMVDALREDIRQQVSRIHNLDLEQNEQRWLTLVSQCSTLSETQIQQAMTQPPPRREQPWTDLIAQLQTIRNAL